MSGDGFKPANPIGPYWARPDLFGFTLLLMYIDSFANEEDDLNTVLNWDPATVEMEIRQEFGAELSANAFDRLMTARSILTSNSFFVSVTDFVRGCVVLSGDSVQGSD